MSLLSAIFPFETEGVKFAKLQRKLRGIADAAGISYSISGLLSDISPGDTQGIKWAKLGAWTQEISDNIGGGGGGVTSVNGATGVVTFAQATAGLVTASGLTMNTAKILGRSTAGAGAVEEISPASNLALAAGTLNLAAALTGIASVTSAGTLTLTSSGGSWVIDSIGQLTGPNLIDTQFGFHVNAGL